jgi:hypothetical protein
MMKMARNINAQTKENYHKDLITDQLAKFLTYVGHENELPKKYQKIYSNNGVVLKYFSKKNNFKLDLVEEIVRSNSFFDIDSIMVTESFIFKQTKELSLARFSDLEKLEKIIINKKKKLLADAKASDILVERLMSLMAAALLKAQEHKASNGAVTAIYQRPRWTHERLFSTYSPDEYDKYRNESKAFVNIEKRFQSKLSMDESFRFKNDMVANSLISWFQSLLLSEPEIVKDHLMAGDFERWLRNSAKERELANICSNLQRKYADEVVSADLVKRDMLRRLRRTSYEGSIYNYLVKPLIKKLKSPDPTTVQQTAIKLMEFGDEKAVESLIEKLFDSIPETRLIVMEALGGISDPRAIQPLIKIFEHSSDKKDKVHALRALGKFDDPKCKSIIEKSSRYDDEIGNEARNILAK